jgi:hypothetical protein
MRCAGGSQHVTTLYNDQVAFYLNAHSNSELQSVLPLCNMTSNWGLQGALAAGNHVFYLPIEKTWLEGMHFGQSVQGDVLCDLYPAPGGIVSSGAATISCTGISMVIGSDDVTTRDAEQTLALSRKNVQSHVFLEPTRIQYNNTQVTASQELRLEVDNLTGNCAALFVVLRGAGATNANNGLFNYTALGGTCKVDFKSASGKSIFGSGQPLDLDYLMDWVWAHTTGTNYAQYNGAIVIPFCDDLKAALSGVRSGGGHVMRSDRDYVSITPPAGFASGVHDIVVYGLMRKQVHAFKGQLSVENA